MEAAATPSEPLTAEQDGANTSMEGYASRGLALFSVIGLSAVFFLSLLWTPPSSDFFTVCGFKNLTGLPCPGCGLTHSFCALGKGRILSAFDFNLLGPPLFAAFGMIWIRGVGVLRGQYRFVRRVDLVVERMRLVRMFGYAFLAYGVARIAALALSGTASFEESPLSRLITRLIH